MNEEPDPESLDCVEAKFDDYDPGQKFWICLPRRTLEAVDASKTRVFVQHKPLATRLVRHVRTTEGVTFDPKVTSGAASFAEIDLHDWLWSRELVIRAIQADIRGPRYSRAGDHLTRRVDLENSSTGRTDSQTVVGRGAAAQRTIRTAAKPLSHEEGKDSSVALTIEEMLEQTQDGESRLFEAPIQRVTEERFFRIWSNPNYPDPIDWDHGLAPLEAPMLGARQTPRIPISILPEPDITASSTAKELVDFYSRDGNNTFLISNKLLEIIQELDPNSLDCRPVIIRTQDGPIDFNLVMLLRNIEAIDLDKTDVLIRSDHIGDQCFKRIRFPKVVIFKKDALKDIHSFSDKDAYGWFLVA